MFFLQLWAFQVKKEGGVLAMAKYDFRNGGKSSKAGLGYSSPQAQVPPQPHPKERALPAGRVIRRVRPDYRQVWSLTQFFAKSVISSFYGSGQSLTTILVGFLKINISIPNFLTGAM